jgi:hypothetical protein
MTKLYLSQKAQNKIAKMNVALNSIKQNQPMTANLKNARKKLQPLIKVLLWKV